MSVYNSSSHRWRQMDSQSSLVRQPCQVVISRFREVCLWSVQWRMTGEDSWCQLLAFMCTGTYKCMLSQVHVHTHIQHTSMHIFKLLGLSSEYSEENSACKIYFLAVAGLRLNPRELSPGSFSQLLWTIPVLTTVPFHLWTCHNVFKYPDAF